MSEISVEFFNASISTSGGNFQVFSSQTVLSSLVMSTTIPSPDLSFGLIADMHYLDSDNGSNYDRTKIRRFRQSLLILQNAIASFGSTGTYFNVMLGDILDGKAKTLGMQYSCLQTIHHLCQQQSSPSPSTSSQWYCVLGNHEYYNFTREELFSQVYFSHIQDKCPHSKLYYSFHPKAGYRCLVLDGYEISTIGPITPEAGHQAEDLLRQRNHNYATGCSSSSPFILSLIFHRKH